MNTHQDLENKKKTHALRRNEHGARVLRDYELCNGLQSQLHCSTAFLGHRDAPWFRALCNKYKAFVSGHFANSSHVKILLHSGKSRLHSAKICFILPKHADSAYLFPFCSFGLILLKVLPAEFNTAYRQRIAVAVTFRQEN